jgi:type IV secretory pathway TrbL component
MKDTLKFLVGSTGWLGTLFCVTAMMTATGAWAWRPVMFTSENWLTALGTCAVVMGTVIGKRALDNSKLAKPGTGDGGA